MERTALQQKRTQVPCMLRNYTMQAVQNDPSLLAEDSSEYSDKRYVDTISKLYMTIVTGMKIPVAKVRRFSIKKLELALSKLEKEQKSEYKELCKYWGVVPEEHRTKKRTNGIVPFKHLNRLTRWGYFDMFFPSMNELVHNMAKKMSTDKDMSENEMAKYASIFALFIQGQCLMPYDLERYSIIFHKLEEAREEVDKYDLKETIFASSMQEEKISVWSAGMLYYMYENYMKDFPDGAISVERIEYFMDLIEYKYKLIIKEFMNMLSAEEKLDFRCMHLSPINTNADVRRLKEEIFPLGMWDSGYMLFMEQVSEEYSRVYRKAYKCFERHGYVLGEGVVPYKNPYQCRHPQSRKTYTMNGFLYADSPAVRISDENELWMMK